MEQINLRKEIMEMLSDFFDMEKHKELTEAELAMLTPEQVEAYSRCHPIYCPHYGEPMPHKPHTPLYPTQWC